MPECDHEYRYRILGYLECKKCGKIKPEISEEEMLGGDMALNYGE